ncbi:MAG: hypothetical protein ACR2P7_04310, partial [bacterium]
MRERGGFIDLRVGHGAGGIGDDSVWPSFTDIMTVIVMIFLMALVIMMVRNFDLDRRLLSSVSAQQASTLANLGLTEQLTASRAEEARLAASSESLAERLATVTA